MTTASSAVEWLMKRLNGLMVAWLKKGKEGVCHRERSMAVQEDVDCRAVARLSALHAMPALHAQAWHAGQAWQAGKDGHGSDADGRLCVTY